MVLGLTRMNRIVEIDEENLTATAEAGVITVDLFNAVASGASSTRPIPAPRTSPRSAATSRKTRAASGA